VDNNFNFAVANQDLDRFRAKLTAMQEERAALEKDLPPLEARHAEAAARASLEDRAAPAPPKEIKNMQARLTELIRVLPVARKMLTEKGDAIGAAAIPILQAKIARMRAEATRIRQEALGEIAAGIAKLAQAVGRDRARNILASTEDAQPIREQYLEKMPLPELGLAKEADLFETDANKFSMSAHQATPLAGFARLFDEAPQRAETEKTHAAT